MVDLDSKLNSLRVNRERRLDLPTPESPISTTTGGRRGEGREERRGEGGEGEEAQRKRMRT